MEISLLSNKLFLRKTFALSFTFLNYRTNSVECDKAQNKVECTFKERIYDEVKERPKGS